MRRRLVLAVGTLLLAAGFAGPVAGQANVVQEQTGVLSAIPADATAFLAIRSLAELDKDIIEVSRTLGFLMGGPNAMFPAPLEWVQEMMGLQQGLDANGGAALVLRNCSQIETFEAMATQFAIVLPATNPQTFIEQLGGEKEEDLYRISLAAQPFFATTKGNYVVAAQTPDGVKAVAKEALGTILTTMSPDRVKAFATQDIFAWVNMRTISPQIRQQVHDTLAGIMMMGGPAGNAQDAAAQVDKFLDESQELALGLALDRRGLDISGYFRMKEGTEMAAQMAASTALEGSLLVGLPDEPTVMALGLACGGAGTEKQMRQGLDRLLKPEMLGEAVTVEQIDALKAGLVKTFTNAELISMSITNLPAAADSGVVGLTVVVRTPSNQQWKEDSRKLFDQIKDMVVKMAQQEEGVEEAQIKAASDAVQWKVKAEELAGASVDHLVVDMAGLPGMSEEDLAQIKAILGPEGVLMRVAPIGEKFVVVTLGGGAQRFTQVAGGVAKGESPLSTSDSIQKVAKRLPPGPRALEAYFNVDQILSLVTTAAARVNQPLLPVPLMMHNAAPITLLSIKVDDAAQEAHFILPMELVLAVKENIPMLMPLFMGGMGGDDGMDMEMEDPPVPEPDSGVK